MRSSVVHRRFGLLLAIAIWLGTAPPAVAQIDPLPSWNDGPAKKAIAAFVQATTTPGSPMFVPPAQRIATFDQDGTLWVEHPLYTQVVYCLERVPAVVQRDPKLRGSSRSRPCSRATAPPWRSSP
jgi:hypothetical protein